MTAPLAKALLELHEGRASLPECVEIWRREERAHGLRILDDHDPTVAPGAHAPRDGQRVSVPRLRSLCHSWERFDRVFEPLDEEALHRLFLERIWPFLAATSVYFLGSELAADHLVAFDTGEVLSLTPELWDRELARAARMLRHEGRADWTPTTLARFLGDDPNRASLVDAARTVIAAADH